MVVVRLEPDPREYDVLIASLWEAGTLGITEGNGFLEAFFEDVEAARRFGEPQPVENQDWVARTQQAFPPLMIGTKFFLAPPWSVEPTPPGRLRLVMNPGGQFGTGYHRTTQLCLEAMERVVRPGDSVLDVGSGSGILSMAAKMLGAGRVVSCDLDPDATRTDALFIGSVDAVKAGAFDVVVANINEDVLGSMRPDFERVARVRILSGFQNEAGEWDCVVI